jgi:hypothetical protein
MTVNNYECGVHDEAEVWIQTTPPRLEATGGKVYLTKLDLLALLRLIDAGDEPGDSTDVIRAALREQAAERWGKIKNKAEFAEFLDSLLFEKK